MFLMAKDFGPYFGRATTRTIMSSDVTFDRSPKGFVDGQILITTDMKYLERTCQSTLTISADNFSAFFKRMARTYEIQFIQ